MKLQTVLEEITIIIFILIIFHLFPGVCLINITKSFFLTQKKS